MAATSLSTWFSYLFPSTSPRLLYYFRLSRTTAAAPLPLFSSALHGLLFFSDPIFFFFAVAVDRKKKVASKQPRFLGGPQRFTEFSRRSSSRSAETLKQNKKNRQLRSFEAFKNTRTPSDTLFSDKSNEHIKPLADETPAYIIHRHPLPRFSGRKRSYLLLWHMTTPVPPINLPAQFDRLFKGLRALCFDH